MKIDKNKEVNDLHFSLLPLNYSFNESVILELVSQKHSKKYKYVLIPSSINPRYVTINANEFKDDLEVGFYRYKLKSSEDYIVVSGLLNVIDKREIQVVTPDESSFDDTSIVYYNGE